MEDWQSRSRYLIGEKALAKLRQARVAVLGLGGVGAQAAEALARSGIGHLILIDGDSYTASNLNRQLFALHSTLGRKKVEVAEERLKDINPQIRITAIPEFYTPETAAQLPLDEADYIVDAFDMVTAKIHLALWAKEQGIPLISAMGAGNRRDPARVELSDLSETKICPLARVMRKELRRRGILHMKVVYSTEEAARAEETQGSLRTLAETDEEGRIQSWTRTVGSMIFVPAAFGITLASAVVEDLIREEEN